MLRLIDLGARVYRKRNGDTLLWTSRAIGISPASLKRVEECICPSLETFAKLCEWLDEDPCAFLGIEVTHD